MDLHANAVAKAVTKIGTVSGVRDDLSGGAVTAAPVTSAFAAAIPASWALRTVL